MLSTNDCHEAAQPWAAPGNGRRTWRVVSLELPTPYFLISYVRQQKRKAAISSTSILWHEDDLLAFCDNVRDDTSVQSVQLNMMLPPAPNSMQSWRMVLVKEIWQGNVRGHEQRAMLYITKDGERIVNSLVTNDERQIEAGTAVFSDTQACNQLSGMIR